MTAFIEIQPTDEAAAVLPRLRRVAVPTDESGEGMALARRAATELAAEHGWEIVLYDRSHERWTDTPHPAGPVGLDDLDPEERGHIVFQMKDIRAAGVPVTAWLATVPSLSAMLDVIQDMGVDGVLMPSELDNPSLMDRLLPGRRPAEMVERVADLQLSEEPPTFLVVNEAGRINVVTNEGAESR